MIERSVQGGRHRNETTLLYTGVAATERASCLDRGESHPSKAALPGQNA